MSIDDKTSNDAGPATPVKLVYCKDVQRRTSQEDCDDIASTTSQVQNGTAAFNIPDMTRGKTQLVVLAISLEPPPSEMPHEGDDMIADGGDMTEMENAGASPDATPTPAATPTPTPKPRASKTPSGPKKVVEKLPGTTEEYYPMVGRNMRAELVGTGFKIVAKGERSQMLSTGGTTTWEWDVTPLEGGDQKLELKTAVEVKIGDKMIPLIPTQEIRTVKVNVRWQDRVHDWLAATPGWIALITGILTALGAMFGAWWVLVRKAKGEPDKPEAAAADAKSAGAAPEPPKEGPAPPDPSSDTDAG